MRFRVFCAALIVALALLGVTATGCSDRSVPRSDPQVETINDNQPLQSDVVRIDGENASVMEDEVAVSIWNKSSDEVLDLYGGPYNRVLLDRYTVTFESSEAIPPVSGGLGWAVDVNRIMSGSIIVVPASLKTQPPLVSLWQGGQIQTIAHITFYGHETGSNQDIRFSTVLQINFANYADKK